MHHITEINRETAVSGRYIPGRHWADEGYGILWVEQLEEITMLTAFVESFAKVANISPIDVRDVESWGHVEERPGQVVYRGAEFVHVVAHIASLHGQIRFSPELDLYVRIERMALEMVRASDVVPFAGPANLSCPDVLPTCFRLAQTEEDGWIQWSSHTESYTSSWLPGFRNEGHRALRMMFMNQADQVWMSGWFKDFGWIKRDHGQILTDAWLILCVDVFVRHSLDVYQPKETWVDSKSSSYRVMYRGEEEVIETWRTALWNPSRAKSEFSADGWLVWRVLKNYIQGTGWQQEWLMDRSGRKFYRLEFELVPPQAESPSSDWSLEFYVAHNLYGARAPLAEWWKSDKRVWRIGRNVLHEPDMWLLPQLRMAGESSKAVLESLQKPAPSRSVIPADEVYEFVTVQIPRLRAQGFSVAMPTIDATRHDLDIRVRVQVKRVKHKQAGGVNAWKRKVGMFQAEELVDFDWSIVIENTEISKQEFEKMVAEKTPYLQLGGSWKLIPLQEIYNQIQSLDTGKFGERTSIVQLSRAVLMSQSEEADESGTNVAMDLSFDEEATDAASIVEGLFRAHHPQLLEISDGFRGTLRDYQRKGYSWLIHLRNLSCGACLADDMGLGKTIQVLAYFQYLKVNGLAKGTHLLICPTSLLQNWKAEISRFTPDLEVHIHHGPGRNGPYDSRQTVFEHALEYADVVMTTYATLVRDLEFIDKQPWDVIVADEAQNIKNAETKQAQALCEIQGNHRIALTGTPVENRLEELWSIFQFVNPGYLGSPTWFRRTFIDRIASRPDSPASKQLHSLLRPVLLRRRKTDPVIQMELPEKWEVREHAALTTEQAALYQSVVNRLFHGIGETQSGMARRGQILAALVRLKQLCDHPCLVSGGSTDMHRSGKLKLLMDLLADVIVEGESALIFTQFRDMGELICDALESHFGWRPRFLHGGLTAAARGDIVNHFQNGKDPSPVLVLSLKAGGVGLNLTRANHVFHFDRWWNPAVEDQATDRAFRIGQTKDVQVHKFLCPGTIEERIDALITQKRALSAAVVGESEGWITELDNNTLRSLFELDVNAAIEEGYD